MSVPVIDELRPLPFGIVLAVQPARDQVSGIEIQRDTDSAGSPAGSPVTVAVLEPGAQTYMDIIGGAGPYHYRARSVRANATASSWTSYVKAKPTNLPASLPNIPQTAEVMGCEISFDANGQVVASVAGDYDTTNLYVKVGDGSAPADPTVASNDGTVAARFGTIATTVKVTTGNDGYVKVVGANVFGSLGEVRTFRAARRLGPFSKSGATRSASGTAETTLQTVTVAANNLGANGALHLVAFFKIDYQFDDCIVRIKWGGTTIYTKQYTPGASLVYPKLDLWVANLNATNSQRIVGMWHDEEVTWNEHIESSQAKDTTASVDLVITGERQDVGLADDVDLLFHAAIYSGTD